MSRHRAPIATLYVRNLSDRVRYEDLKRLFQKYGRVVDVTLPLDYYSRSPKGYCFVQYEDPRDAEDALYRLDRQRLYGREIEVEFARGDRKTPGEMRSRDRQGGRYGSRRSRSRTRSRSRDDNDRKRRRRSRTRSYSKGRRSGSPNNNKSVSRERSRSPVDRDRSKSPVNERSSNNNNESNHSRSPSGSRSPSPAD